MVDHKNRDFKTQQQAWDRRYLVKGRQWGNAPHEFPQITTKGFVLELGIGDGKNLRVRKTGSKMIGIDFSREAVKLCHSDPSLTNISLLVGDGCLLPIKDEKVSLIFAHHVLGHIPSDKISGFIHEMYRVLMPGGTAAVTVFGSGDMRDGNGWEVEPGLYLRGDGIITRYFSSHKLESFFSEFIIEEIAHETWNLKIRGKKHPRKILSARIKKPLRYLLNVENK